MLRVMDHFMATTRTTTPLIAFDKRGITYLVATNVGWLPNLVDKGILYVHYFARRMRRQFGLDQDILDDFTTILETTISIHPFFRLSDLEFWSKHFIAVTILSSRREVFVLPKCMGYW